MTKGNTECLNDEGKYCENESGCLNMPQRDIIFQLITHHQKCAYCAARAIIYGSQSGQRRVEGEVVTWRVNEYVLDLKSTPKKKAVYPQKSLNNFAPQNTCPQYFIHLCVLTYIKAQVQTKHNIISFHLNNTVGRQEKT